VSGAYRNNHYVPQWYQRRFIPEERTQRELFYLDLKPVGFTDARGGKHKRRALRRLGPGGCFAENDLYTTPFGGIQSRDIERLFFGQVDARGKEAVEFFSSFDHRKIDGDAFRALLLYLSTQKLRTPKGLDWLRERTRASTQEETLRQLLTLRDAYSAIWTECVWQIANAEATSTKFIISDHPVTVYNRSCGPRNRQWCRGSNDPDIRLHATHTLFPLSSDQILILTNRTWAQNPHRPPQELRPNPDLFRGAMFNFWDIQIERQLSEREVLEINFIIKSRAYRYVAAGAEEWLYPEQEISKSDWAKFGDGYLLMPDPRPLIHGEEWVVGYADGSAESLDGLGRLPRDPDFGLEASSTEEMKSLATFKAEFARLYGPRRRGRSFTEGRLDPESDDDDEHQRHLSRD
jgi:Protein of unknown function (DUF4238)